MDTMGDNGQALPALSLTDIDTTISGEPRILDLRLAEALGFKKPRDIRPLIERHLDALERLGGICRTVRQNPGRGRPATEFWLTKKQAIYITTKAETDRATDITIAVVELFDAATGAAAPPAPAPALTRADLDAIDQRARRIGQEEERRARAALTGQALDRLRRGEPIDAAQLDAARFDAARPALSAAPPPPPPRRTHAQSVDLAVAHLRALPPELREEGFRLTRAVKAHSDALKELKAATEAIHSPLDAVAEILEREAHTLRQTLAAQPTTARSATAPGDRA
ncbi:hypothetical protein D3877_01800 [Azospirillum cavernae]|uniref:Uncharacterized protein n=1 Tax=Azospirillum cavernae TaxID=2320860 RepID=A0A418W087_9PROT|nr:hypothetical protein [Azospirillum cavernae]RJF83430.1 hypothetical protein D3877_01800 [Azospirillum cavernae]